MNRVRERNARTQYADRVFARMCKWRGCASAYLFAAEVAAPGSSDRIAAMRKVWLYQRAMWRALRIMEAIEGDARLENAERNFGGMLN